ncbi:MAG: hypothetical protein J5884_05830 [Paludibacteraceae bacterium]|nr:hypothetical protein [Paludibacteraceae bacterium]
MKRWKLIVGLLVLSCAVFGYDKTQHVFPTNIANYAASTVYMTDGATYTCNSNASLAAQSDGDPFYLKLKKNGVVVLSPAIANLREISIHHTGGNISLNVYTSTDGSDWGTAESASTSAGLVRVLGLAGDYQVKIVNKSDGDVYIMQIDYWTEPCHCLRVVSE